MDKHVLFSVLMAMPGLAATAQTTPAAAVKTATQTNPVSPFLFCADPTAVEHDGRLYVYGTNDHYQYVANGGTGKNGYGAIKSLVVLSTDDMVNWTHHGIIDVGRLCGSWCAASWAPSVVSRTEDDGLTHFYLYFSNSGGGVGVLTATSPTGPWTSPLDHALISKSTPGVGNCSWPFDPGVAIDDDGTGWIAFGGGNVTAGGSELLRGNARIAQLGRDMISIEGSAVDVPAPYHFEANELNVMNGKLVLTYCSSWSERTEWPKYGSPLDAPTACSMCYMATDTPLDPSSWKYKGQYLKNPGAFGYPYSNNHTHLQKFGNAYYLFYHTQWLENALATGASGFRNIAVNRASVVERLQRVGEVKASNSGVSQLKKANPYAQRQAECFATSGGLDYANIFSERLASRNDSHLNQVVGRLAAGMWTMVRGVDFGSDGAAQFAARLRGGGTLEVRLDRVDAAPVATLRFDSPDFAEHTVDLADGAVAAGIHDVYFVFTRADGDARFDTWRFLAAAPNAVAHLPNGNGAQRVDYLDLAGRNLPDVPGRGLVLRRTVLGDGTARTEKVRF